MKKARYALAHALYLLSFSLTSAQISVTYPTDRVVFQRDKSDNAVIVIGGYTTECIDRLEARFVPIKSNPSKDVLGRPTPSGGGWAIIQNTSTCGNFSGSLLVPAGWYRLEVRGMRSGKDPLSGSVQHVGIGDVYLVAGQSNSTGGDGNISGPGASEDAVSSVNFRNQNNDTYSSLKLPCPEYVHLDKNTTMAPFGNYAWCWGSFGDRMIEKYHVPVMIFNSGWSATGIENWKQSIPPDGVTTAWFGANYPAGLPFGHMRIALNNYIAQLGIRAVLWHQGETDNFMGTTQEKYRNDLREVIQESRNLSGKANLAWVVARASRYSYSRNSEAAYSRTAAEVIDAQNDVIGIGSHGTDPLYKKDAVFPGPDTDPYYDSNYRSDEVHFAGGGLDSLAKFWVQKLDSYFFANSTPYPAILPASIGISQAGAKVTFSATEGWNAYNWLDKNCDNIQPSSFQLTTGPGLYRLKSTDANNNSVLSPSLFVAASSSLPVTWKYFRASPNDNLGVSLQWATTEEVNTSYFEVERGTDAVNFTTLQRQSAAGNTNNLSEYFYHDYLLRPGIYYYRIKQTDMDGKFSFSRMISLKVGHEETISVFPNPVTDNLNIQAEKTINLVEIFNSAGVRILSSVLQANSVKLNMIEYPSGIYTIRVNGENFKILK